VISINSRELLTRCRERLHDRDSRAFADDEILRAGDDCMRGLFTKLRMNGDDIGLDSIDVATNTLTVLETDVYQWTPPEYVSDIQLVELSQTNGRPWPVPKVTLEQKDAGRRTNYAQGPLWHFGPRDVVQIRGTPITWPTMRVWFVRSTPPMGYSTAASGTTTTFATGVGGLTVGLKQRADLYVGTQFEVTASATAADVGKIVRVTAHTWNGTSSTYTFTPALTGAVTTATSFATLLPLPAEYSEYLIALVCMKMFRRQGSPEEQKAMFFELKPLEDAFEAGIPRRSTGEPTRIISSRY